MKIIHTADSHGTGLVYQAVRECMDSETLLLDAGDTLLGSNTAFRWEEPNLTLMSELGYHCMTMGNRELHYVPTILERRAGQRSFPLLAANLVDLWGRPTTWQEGVSLTLGDLKIGVFGMTVVQYPVGSFYEKIFGLRFLSPELLIENLTEKFQEEHDFVIFLSHLGIQEDRRLAEQLQKKPHLRCDLILGGHTHISLPTPERYGHTQLSHIGAHSTGFGVWEYNGKNWDFSYQKIDELAKAQ